MKEITRIILRPEHEAELNKTIDDDVGYIGMEVLNGVGTSCEILPAGRSRGFSDDEHDQYFLHMLRHKERVFVPYHKSPNNGPKGISERDHWTSRHMQEESSDYFQIFCTIYEKPVFFRIDGTRNKIIPHSIEA